MKFRNLFVRFGDWVAGLPEWLRPVAIGAGLLLMIVGGRMIYAILVLLFFVWHLGPTALAIFVGVLVLATFAGAMGGLAFSLTSPRMRSLGRAGAYTTGWVTVAAYFAPLLLGLGSIDPEGFSIRDPAVWFAFGGCSLLFGGMFGHALADTWSEFPD